MLGSPWEPGGDGNESSQGNLTRKFSSVERCELIAYCSALNVGQSFVSQHPSMHLSFPLTVYIDAHPFESHHKPEKA